MRFLALALSLSVLSAGCAATRPVTETAEEEIAPERSEADYRQMLALDPANVAAYEGLSRLLPADERLEKLEPLLRSLIAKRPELVVWSIKLALLLDDENPQEAERVLRAALARNSSAVAVAKALVSFLEFHERSAESEAVLREFLKRHADSWDGHMAYAQWLIGRQRIEDAAGELGAAIRARPDRQEAYAVLATLLLETGRKKEAEACFEPLKSANPAAYAKRWLILAKSGDEKSGEGYVLRQLEETPGDAEALKLAVALLSVNGRYEQAEPHLRALLAKPPADLSRAEILVVLSVNLDAQKRPDEADQALLQSVEAAGADERSIRGAVQALEDRKRLHVLDGLVELVNRLKPGQGGKVYLHAASLFSGGNASDEAERYLKLAVQAMPADAEGYLGLAKLQIRRGRPAEVEPLAQALGQHDAQAAGGFYRDLAQTFKGDSEPAGIAEWVGRFYLKAVDLEPKDAALLDEAAAYLMEAGRYVEAETLFERRLAMEPDNAEVQLNVARLQSNQGRDKEAIARLRQLLERHPGQTEASVGLAYLLVTEKQGAEAVTLMEQVLKAQPEELGYLYVYALALDDAKRYAEAEAVMRKLTADFPEDMIYGNQLAMALVHLGNLKDAELTLRGLLAAKDEPLADPDKGLLTCNLAVVLSRMGRHKEAETLYKEALRLAPESDLHHFYYGLWLQAQGRKKEAVPFLEKGKERNLQDDGDPFIYFGVTW